MFLVKRPLCAGAILATFAASAGSASAACLRPEQVAPQTVVQQFLADPPDLLKRFSDRLPGLTSEARRLLASDEKTLPAMVGLVGTANARQREALGAALGQAARMCQSEGGGGYARSIQDAVIGTNAREVVQSFQGVTGDGRTASTGAGSGSGAGSGGGAAGTNVSVSGGAGGGARGAPGGGSVPNTAPNPFIGGGGSLLPDDTSTNRSTLANTPLGGLSCISGCD